ncbi:MAG: FKBP-type peptidyl-prolyl cis-trans isomerase [bacterium]
MSVKNGDKIAVHYTGWLENGTKFDSSIDSGETFKFQVGSEMVIKGFDDAVVGMEVGEKKKVTIPPSEAYGEKSDEFIITVERKNFPPQSKIEVGEMFEMHSEHGDVVPVKIVEVKEDFVVLDANHPLAGEALVFEIELIETGVEIPDYAHHHECCCGDNDCNEEKNDCKCGNGSCHDSD